MTAQTTYEASPAIGFNGMLAEQFSLRQVDTGLVEGTAMALGVAVIPGTGKDQYVAASADEFVGGIVIYQGATESVGTFEYADKETFPLLTKGRYYAIANGVIAPNTVLGYDPATGKVGPVVGATTTLGFGSAVDAAGADGDLFIVEVNF